MPKEKKSKSDSSESSNSSVSLSDALFGQKGKVNEDIANIFSKALSQPPVIYKNDYSNQPVREYKGENSNEGSDEEVAKPIKEKSKKKKELKTNTKEAVKQQKRKREVDSDQDEEESEEKQPSISRKEEKSKEKKKPSLNTEKKQKPTSNKKSEEKQKKKATKSDSEDEDEESDKSEEEEEVAEDNEDDASNDDDEDDEEEEQDTKNENTIFLGNLPTSIPQEKLKKELKTIFSKFGTVVSVRIRSAPYANPKLTKKAGAVKEEYLAQRDSMNGYVVFDDSDPVSKAVEMNDFEFHGRHIRVDRADHKLYDHKRTIFVGNLPYDASEEQLREFFSTCGKISAVRIVRDAQHSIGKGFGYLEFQDSSSVALAMSLNGAEFAKRELRIQPCFRKPKEKKKSHLNAENQPGAKRIASKKEEHRLKTFQGAVSEKGKASNRVKPRTNNNNSNSNTNNSSKKQFPVKNGNKTVNNNNNNKKREAPIRQRDDKKNPSAEQQQQGTKRKVSSEEYFAMRKAEKKAKRKDRREKEKQ